MRGEEQFEDAAAGARASWTLSRPARWGVFALYGCAIVLFCRCLLLNDVQYLDLDRYIAGTERLPYQRRLLPMWMLRACLRIPLPAALASGRHGIFAHPAEMYLFLFNVMDLALAGWLAVLLYRAAMPRGRFGLLVFPVLLYVAAWTYLLHPEANLAFPYDLASLVYFSAGVLLIYTRRYWWLLAVMAVGSFNRETTMFLVPLFVLDAAALGGWRFDWRRVPWLKAAGLAVVWAAIYAYLGTLFRGNDATDQFLRLGYNVRFLGPDHWPQDLGACGFLLPVLLLLRRRIPDVRVAAYVLIVPVWFAFMLVFGVIEETRVYGELCAFTAVAAVMLLDAYTMERIFVAPEAARAVE